MEFWASSFAQINKLALIHKMIWLMDAVQQEKEMTSEPIVEMKA